MNKDIESKVKDLKDSLLSEELIKEYIKSKNAIFDSKTLQNYENILKYLQKCDMSEEEKREYDKALNEFKNDPFVQNYIKLENEKTELLKEIKDILDI